MTRINSAIPPKQLCDQHLLAEYRELPRISTLTWKRFEKAKQEDKDQMPARGPSEFTLGAGHMIFFTYLGTFCFKRYQSLVKEMQRRGFKTQYVEYRMHPKGMNLDHTPTEQERKLLDERICQSMPANPRWTNCLQYVIFRNDRAAFSGDERQIASYLKRNIERIGEYTVYAQEDANDRTEPMTADEWLTVLEEAEAMDRETPQCVKTKTV